MYTMHYEITVKLYRYTVYVIESYEPVRRISSTVSSDLRYKILYSQKISRDPIFRNFEVLCLTLKILSSNQPQPFLNQVHAGHRPMHLVSQNCFSPQISVCMFGCVCVCPKAMNNQWGVIQTPYDWSNKLYGFYMAVVVDIISGRDVRIHTPSWKLAQ